MKEVGTKYFSTLGEAYKHISKIAETLWGVEAAGQIHSMKIMKATSEYYCVHAFDVFGEFLGILQVDGTVKKEVTHEKEG